MLKALRKVRDSLSSGNGSPPRDRHVTQRRRQPSKLVTPPPARPRSKKNSPNAIAKPKVAAAKPKAVPASKKKENIDPKSDVVKIAKKDGRIKALQVRKYLDQVNVADTIPDLLGGYLSKDAMMRSPSLLPRRSSVVTRRGVNFDACPSPPPRSPRSSLPPGLGGRRIDFSDDETGRDMFMEHSSGSGGKVSAFLYGQRSKNLRRKIGKLEELKISNSSCPDLLLSEAGLAVEDIEAVLKARGVEERMRRVIENTAQDSDEEWDIEDPELLELERRMMVGGQ